MLATGDYSDMFDTSYYTGSLVDLYNQGIIMDLTDYVNTKMPHYLAWLDAHPLYKKQVLTKVGDGFKYLKLFDVSDSHDPWGGYEYRRDWLVKYATNPTTGAAFTGGYDANGVWSDDVVFPNGGSDPIYISDWEWMLAAFKKAIADQKIEGGYPFSLPYPGFNETGDLVSAFNCGPYFYTDSDTKVQFGGSSENFRSYLEAMNTWYKNGWLDKRFSERTSDAFYLIDTTSVFSGKVGLWYGVIDQANKSLDTGDEEYTKGACVFGARQPINNKYGPDSAKNKTPTVFYQGGYLAGGTCITSKAKDKDLDALFAMLDYMYSDEGMMLITAGLNKEQYEETKDPYYTKMGLTDGAYKFVDSTGIDWVEGTSTGTKYYKLNPLLEGKSYAGSCFGIRMTGRRAGYKTKYSSESMVSQHAQKEFDAYEAKTSLLDHAPLSVDDNTFYSAKLTSIREFMSKYAPSYVTGAKDASKDTDWANFTSALSKYKLTEIKAILQAGVDELSAA